MNNIFTIESIIWTIGEPDLMELQPHTLKERQLSYFGLDDLWEIQYFDNDKAMIDHMMTWEPPYVIIASNPSLLTSFRDFVHIQLPSNPTDTYLDPCAWEGSCNINFSLVQHETSNLATK